MVPTDSPNYAALVARRLQDATDALEAARIASLLSMDPDAPVPYIPTDYPDPVDATPLDFRAGLARIRDWANMAEEALDDEHEGNVREAVALLSEEARGLLSLVRSW